MHIINIQEVGGATLITCTVFFQDPRIHEPY